MNAELRAAVDHLAAEIVEIPSDLVPSDSRKFRSSPRCCDYCRAKSSARFPVVQQPDGSYACQDEATCGTRPVNA